MRISAGGSVQASCGVIGIECFILEYGGVHPGVSLTDSSGERC